MAEILVKANAMPVEDRHRAASVESFIEGPRSALGPLWLDQAVMRHNQMMTAKGWEPVHIAWQREDKSWFRKAIVYRIEGQAYPVQVFIDTINSFIQEVNG